MERALHATHADHWDRRRAWPPRPPGRARPGVWLPPTARRCHRRARGPAVPGVSCVPIGASAVARNVLISETASAPPSCAANAHAATSAQLGVSLTIKRLVQLRSDGAQHTLQRDRVGTDVKAGVHVGTGDVQLHRGYLRARVARSQQLRDLLGGGAHHVGDERHGQTCELGQVLCDVALQALVGQADRVDQAGLGLPQPRRRVAGAWRERDRLGDECGERELARRAHRRTRGARRSRRTCPSR